MLKPIVKYQGGKSKELPTIKQFISGDRIVEPFAGGAAVSFYAQKPAVLQDVNRNVINLYEVVASEDFIELYNKVNELKQADHDILEECYYEARDYLNSSDETGLDRAFHYIVLRQLCFSGMERYNSAGEFNVPFGHYQSFSCNLSPKHHEYLKTCQISLGSFETVQTLPTDFVFLDPPYLDKLGYGSDDSNLHSKLAEFVEGLDCPWLLVHSDCEFYRDTYSKYNIVSNAFNYGQRFGKDKDHSKASVEHLYISNIKKDIKFYKGTKEGLQEELCDRISSLGIQADREIISKLTGKTCQYFLDII